MQRVNTSKSPLFLEGWLEFNRIKWNVEPVHKRFVLEDGAVPRIETVYYLNKAGRIVQPGLNPYLPVAFEATPSPNRHRVCSQWLAVARQFVQDMQSHDLRNGVELSPEITDIRPWQWSGFRVSVRYTYYLELPLDCSSIDKATRNRIKRAEKLGYICERTDNMAHVLDCLNDTEKRQHFSYRLTMQDLELIQSLLGNEHLRAYVCYAPDGEPASSSVDLHVPGSRAIGWVGGTKRAHLQSGATQFLTSYELADLQNAGAIGIDFAGANIPSVAAAKRSWGGYLVPSYFIEGFTLRSMAKLARDWWRFMDTRRGGLSWACAFLSSSAHSEALVLPLMTVPFFS